MLAAKNINAEIEKRRAAIRGLWRVVNVSQVNHANAHHLNDNFAICSETVFFGVEHNQSEAAAVANGLESDKGVLVVVINNPVDVVRAAKLIQPRPARFQFRDEYL